MTELASNPEAGPEEVVLLAVTGMSPAILTETVWALAQESPPVLPTRVIALTTVAGRERLQADLLGASASLGGSSPWEALRAALEEHGLDLEGRLRFGTTPDDIRVITGVDPATGRSHELEDIRSVADNESAGDFLLEQVRSIVENPDTQLIASLAGGRKTMGALLYACLTLAGRESDRLTHVLVNEPFERTPGFWFPGQAGGPLTVRGSEALLDPTTAQVELADVPFVPLRNLFARELNRKAGTFSRLVASCRDSVRRRIGETLRVSLNLSRTELEVNSQAVKLAPREQAVMLFLAGRAKAGQTAISDYQNAVEPLNDSVAELMAGASTKNFADWRYDLQANFDEEALRKLISSIRGKLKRRGGDAALLAGCLPERGRCSLDVPGSMVFIAGDSAQSDL
jgi:CRISPR-associated protein (TIGR02584 family)